MNDNQLVYLIQKYLKGECTSEEAKMVEDWYEQQDHAGDFYGNDARLINQAEQRSLSAIKNKAGIKNRVVRISATWIRIAAAILLFIGIGAYFMLRHPDAQFAQDIAPGSNKAVLTLANGKKIVLTGAKNGQIASQSTVVITKKTDGQISYQATDAETGTAIAYNTITTPRGGQYTVILADGTTVILNAASSLRYPESFTGKERRVELTGEAYFEVAKNKQMPFRVTSAHQTVEVLGTHFNVNAYQDEPASVTTLLEGSVNIAADKQPAHLLAPGQQALNPASGGSVVIEEADTQAAIAWVKGRFKFSNENIESIMRKVSRWYNVDVVFDGDMKGKDFAGTISRYDNVSKVLEMLQSTNTVHFKIEGRRIIVTE